MVTADLELIGNRRPRAFDATARLALPLLGVVLVIGAWWGGYILLRPAPYLLPSPDDVVARIVSDRVSLMQNARTTVEVALMAFAFSATVGVLFGMAIAQSRPLKALVMPPIIAMQCIPKIALAPIVIAWFGFGTFPQVIVAVLVAIFPVLIATIVGVEMVSRDTINLARSIGCRPLTLVYRILLPTAAPYIGAGLRISATLAVVGAIVAEFIGSTAGIGNLILTAAAIRDTPLVFAGVIVAGGSGYLIYGFAALAVRLATWRLSSRYMTTVV